MNRRILLVAGFFAFSTSFSVIASAVETATEKVETATNKGTDKVKKGYRKAKDEACEMGNGKMSCMGKKVKHGIENGTDAMKTKAKDVEKKTD